MGYHVALRRLAEKTTKTMMLALNPIELRDDKVQWNLTRFWRAA